MKRNGQIHRKPQHFKTYWNAYITRESELIIKNIPIKLISRPDGITGKFYQNLNKKCHPYANYSNIQGKSGRSFMKPTYTINRQLTNLIIIWVIDLMIKPNKNSTYGTHTQKNPRYFSRKKKIVSQCQHGHEPKSFFFFFSKVLC